jgi:hypothetical protein
MLVKSCYNKSVFAMEVNGCYGVNGCNGKSLVAMESHCFPYKSMVAMKSHWLLSESLVVVKNHWFQCMYIFDKESH